VSGRWRSRAFGLGLAAAAFAAAFACRPDNTLQGSVDALFPLDVSRVDMLRNDDAFQVSYYANRGADIDLVARLTVYVGDTGIDAGTPLLIQGEYLPGHQRATVVHLTAGEAERVLPAVERGDLLVEQGGGIGQPTRGSFAVLFVQGDAYGSGRTLDGTFAGRPGDAGWMP